MKRVLMFVAVLVSIVAFAGGLFAQTTSTKPATQEKPQTETVKKAETKAMESAKAPAAKTSKATVKKHSKKHMKKPAATKVPAKTEGEAK